MSQRRLFWSGFILGAGFGGFFDGIVLHQLLQWHHVASSLIPMDSLNGLEQNTFWDGVFHSAMYGVAVAGVFLLWRALRQPGTRFDARLILSAVAIGFGAFHILDSVLFHWVLNLHHICYGPNLVACDAGYFVMGVALVAVGVLALALRRRPHSLQAGSR